MLYLNVLKFSSKFVHHAEQDHLVMLFYDEQLSLRLAKQVGTPNPEALILIRAKPLTTVPARRKRLRLDTPSGTLVSPAQT
jgi:hypothetical protein